MRFPILLIMLALFIGACSTGGGSSSDGSGLDAGDNIDPNADEDQKEAEAYGATGDVRVYFYIKAASVQGGIRTSGGSMVEQDEQRHTLVNKSHTFYMGKADQDAPPEQRFLRNTDMYDLLQIFKELGFFESGASVNIFGDEPIARADRERNTTRIIAVEIIRDGKINTSYFARRENEHEVDKDRAKLFNDCQAVMMQAIGGSLPRGNADYGTSDDNKIRKQR